MKTFKVLSALLAYPTDELVAARSELISVLEDEGLVTGDPLEGLEALIDEIAHDDLFEAQERYIQLFDRTRALSLHLFEHVHGESRDRGQAMVDLIRVYEDHGFTPTIKELPDFTPLFLEYASLLPLNEAVALVAQPAHVFAAIRERLVKRGSSYAALFSALGQIGAVKPDSELVAKLMKEPDPEPDDLEALDAAWQEEEVLFGPGAAAEDCGIDSLAAKLRQVRRPAPGMPLPAADANKPVITHSGTTIQQGA